MVTSDQSRKRLAFGRKCSGVAPHLSDGSSAIGTAFAKEQVFLAGHSKRVQVRMEGPLLNNQPTDCD
jgi:hypothetical protein